MVGTERGGGEQKGGGGGLHYVEGGWVCDFPLFLPSLVHKTYRMCMQQRKLFFLLSTQHLNMYCPSPTHTAAPLPQLGNWETLRFLLSNARWWMDEYKFDGYRFDGGGRRGEKGGVWRVGRAGFTGRDSES